MRIAIISPIEMRVPPPAYGGIELVVGLLADGLVVGGHDVTLFASGDSVTRARLEAVSDHHLRGTASNKGMLGLMNAVSCLEQAHRFDIIHNHTDEGLALAGLVRQPMLTTIHGAPHRDWRKLFQRYSGWYTTVSESGKAQLPPAARFAGVVYNAIDVDSYPFNGNSGRGQHLLFLSRMCVEKGPHLAIEVAKRLGRKLVLAGNVAPSDEAFFRAYVEPEIDGDQIVYYGEADWAAKRELLLEPHCLLAPLTWPEPFGLFMVEAMACGTPVIALNKGAAPEVIKHGQTGFVVDTLEEMANAVELVAQLDRERCRQHVRLHFDAPRMVEDYLDTYERVLSEHAQLPLRTAV